MDFLFFLKYNLAVDSSEKRARIHLSVPELSELEEDFLFQALRSGWVSTVGPSISMFEQEIAEFTNSKFAVALSSGTAALHLAYKSCNLLKGDDVIVPTTTFAATVFPIQYLDARPIFVDVDSTNMTIDSNVLAEVLVKKRRSNSLPKAIVCVDIYGVPCDYSSLEILSKEFEIPLICDAAESIGATVHGKQIGTFGKCSALSFNGNKIMTTSGGGMLLTDDEELARRVKFWANQSKEPVPWYEHREIGHNYRLSNILAGLGRAQLRRLPEFVLKRRKIRSWYSELLSSIDGVEILMDPPWGTSNAWLTIALFNPKIYPDAPTRLIKALENENVESRHLWKPMHKQPVFASFESHITGVADDLFNRGLCLPSSASLTKSDVERICQLMIEALSNIQ
jgi:dTDP-4-amino-4,6-dideoxygalactose transaminase